MAELYTCWSEPPEALLWRHVGRAGLLDRLLEGARRFFAGEDPRAVWIHGPPGSGRTHLLAVLAERLAEGAEAAGVELVRVHEDLPGHRSAEALRQRLARSGDLRPWTLWPDEEASGGAESSRRVLLFDGLDRQLRSLGANGRTALRAALAGTTWIVGTADRGPEEVTSPTEAFRGAFSVEALGPLPEREAEDLLDRTGPEDSARPGRRATLVVLAGGVPRTLVALSEQVAAEPDGSAAGHLSRVLANWTPELRLRYRGLSSQAQRVLERVSEAPRALTPTELARHLGRSPSAISVLCNRLVDDGVLRREVRGRNSLYTVVDPVLRYWLEERGGAWPGSRIHLACELLEVAGRNREGSSGPPVVRDPDWEAVVAEAEGSLSRGDLGAARPALKRARTLPASPDSTLRLACALPDDLAGKLPLLGPLVVHAGDSALRAVLTFALALRQGPDAVPGAFVQLLASLAEAVGDKEATVGFGPVDYLRWQHLARLVSSVIGAVPPVAAIPLERSAQEQLARLPYLRGVFIQRGFGAADPPLVTREAVQPWAPPGTDPTLERLLAVFHRDGDGPRCEAALALVRRYEGRLPRCSAPHRPVAGGADLVAELAGPHGPGLRWAASFARASGEAFTGLLVRFADAPAGRLVDPVVLLAMSRLARESSDRADTLLGVLGDAHRPLAEGVHQLTSQLAAAANGPLHAELQALSDLLD